MSSGTFVAADYAVFATMLLASAAIGVYYRFTGGRQQTTKEYLLADGNMSVLPVAFSLMASFMSAVTLLGVAAENYIYGSIFVIINISYVIGTPICAYVFFPVFFQVKCTSAYGYLELRFGKSTRLMASFIFILQMVLYMSIVLYAPALALSAVTGISHWISIISVGVVCTFYCTIGGMKAVLWTDVLQSLLMFTALFTVIIKGTIDVGGLEKVFNIASKGGRLNFNNFDPNPLERHTFWTLAIGGIFIYCSLYGVNQAQVQRLLTIRNKSNAQLALFLNWPITTFLSLTTSLTGLVMYANISSCDPLLMPNESNVKSNDQLLPYYVVKSLGQYPGIPGLFVAGIFSGALSTVSSAVNSLATVTLEDFVKPYILHKTGKEMNDSKAAMLSKVLACLYGCLCVALTYAAEQLGGILEASLTIFGVVGGPLLGVFTLGMIFKNANQKGAMIGFIFALLFSLWLGFGARIWGLPPQKLPLTTEGCPSSNISSIMEPIESVLLFETTTLNSSVTIISDIPMEKEVFWFYKISYMWYAGIGWLLTVSIGLLASILTGGMKYIDPTLLSPVVRNWKLCGIKKTPLEVALEEYEDESKM